MVKWMISDIIFLHLVVLVVGFLIVKKVATCLIKTIIGIVVLAILAGIYWMYIA